MGEKLQERELLQKILKELEGVKKQVAMLTDQVMQLLLERVINNPMTPPDRRKKARKMLAVLRDSS